MSESDRPRNEIRDLRRALEFELASDRLRPAGLILQAFDRACVRAATRPDPLALRDVLVIEPGHGSVWLHDVTESEIDGQPVVSGWTLDEGGVGSSLMPDDFRGERITLTYPTSLIRKEVFR